FIGLNQKCDYCSSLILETDTQRKSPSHEESTTRTSELIGELIPVFHNKPPSRTNIPFHRYKTDFISAYQHTTSTKPYIPFHHHDVCHQCLCRPLPRWQGDYLPTNHLLPVRKTRPTMPEALNPREPSPDDPIRRANNRDATPRERGRPVIVDERPLRRHPRVPSIGAIVCERPAVRRARSQSLATDGKPNRRASVQWESPSTSHTSFDLRARREAEAAAEAEATTAAEELERRVLAAERERRREQRISEQDEEIRRRPARPYREMGIGGKGGGGDEAQVERETDAQEEILGWAWESETSRSL
ncbi:hypothetical protein BUE80_DR006454, partial [Diplocarpon rosae]